ncbi:M42 family metallopeptidase [Celerinatantimonas yamalensis]|uniref:M42 family metallopeptidase n=1 Tax=Celerinatantimonas yamalensis TaxID=559956 RepID=A0ABW9G7I1_9GAMM
MRDKIDRTYVTRLAQEILTIDSPSGYCHQVMARIEQECQVYKGVFSRDHKGNGRFTIQGQDKSRTIGVGVHVDTLGAMVRSIDAEGRIHFAAIGGLIWPTADGEYCTIRTRDGRHYSGTFLSLSPAAHVFKDAKSRTREPEQMYVRLDEVVQNRDDVTRLGIQVGDYICLDPKTVLTDSGFIKSRFIDDKINVASVFGLLKLFAEQQIVPQYNVTFLFSTYEEVGHGAACLPAEISEFIAVDMGCIGEDLTCNERQVSICAKDSSGPYDYQMVSHLIELATRYHLDFAVDVYPFYSSDASAALRGGRDIRAALIGPGVHASHGMERTHYLGLEHTITLLGAYLQSGAPHP